MKTFSGYILLLPMLCLLASCETRIATGTVVHPDGRLDRTVIFEEADSAEMTVNIFGISKERGWNMEAERMKDGIPAADGDLVIRFTKTFQSPEQANTAMDPANDTLFRIESRLDKKFRWFYTYLEYTDTYRALDRFKHVSQDDFFTEEDHAFIGRLPAEGAAISRADSFYLMQLNDKIYQYYAGRGFFEEFYRGLTVVMKAHQVESRWFDTLARHKEGLFMNLLNEKDTPTDMDEELFLRMADKLHIPLEYNKALPDFREQMTDFGHRVNFMSQANEGKYSHRIEMPWPVIHTNADSVAGPVAYWHPPVAKFLLNDYVMRAEARTMNYWAVAVSAMLIIGTIVIGWRKKHRVSGG